MYNKLYNYVESSILDSLSKDEVMSVNNTTIDIVSLFLSMHSKEDGLGKGSSKDYPLYCYAIF